MSKVLGAALAAVFLVSAAPGVAQPRYYHHHHWRHHHYWHGRHCYWRHGHRVCRR